MEFLSDIGTFLNEIFAYKLAQAVAIIIGSLIAARLADFVITRFLLSLAKRTKTTFDDDLIEVLHRPIFTTVVLVGLGMSLPLFELEAPFPFVLNGVILTIGILIWTLALFRINDVMLTQLSRVADGYAWLDSSTLPLFTNVAKIVLVALAVYALLLSWDIDATAWVASAGIIGLALGLAAKDTLANLFGGIFVLADAPYKVGDYIILDSAERGVVTKIGLRSTRMLTRDDIEITIPNSITANATIVNETGGPWEKERIRATIGIAYGSDIDNAIRVLEETARSIEDVASNPEPRVRFREFGDSALIFQVLCWIREPELRGFVLHQLNCAIYKNLAKADIEIPFPQRVVHLQQDISHDPEE